MRWLPIWLVGVLLLAGCATQGTNSINYTAPKLSNVVNEKILPRAQSVVWDELVRELSKSFFVINNIERESRIINVSFNSNSPTDYVDCGRTQRSYSEGDKVENFEYAVAERSKFKMAGDKPAHPSFSTWAIVNRITSLEGRSNIYVAPDAKDNTKTVVSVNTRYIMSVRLSGEMVVMKAGGIPVSSRSIPSESTPFIFNTNKPSTTPTGPISVVCGGIGRLETEILNMIQ